MLLDEGYMVHKGESTLFLNRDMYKYYNMIMSMDLTLAMKAILPPYEIVNAEGETIKYPQTGVVANLPLGSEGYKLTQLPDINAANRVIDQAISTALQRGGSSDIDLGTSRSPMPPSARFITEQGEIRQRLQSPRLDALVSLSEQASRIAIDMYIKGEFDTEIGRRGRRLTLSYKDLGNPEDYDVTYRAMSWSKTHEFTNMAVAGASRGIVSRETIVRNILLTDDPEMELARLEAEEAESLDPLLKYIRSFCKLIDIAESTQDEDEKEQKYLEAISLVQTAEALARQRNQPQFQPQQPQVEEPKPDNQLLNIMGGQIGGLGG